VTVVAFCSGKGSPGVSTLSCVAGAVWPHSRRIVVAECDPSGNDLAARFGLSPRLGMTSLVLASRRSPSGRSETLLDAHVQTLPGGLEVLVGPVSHDSSSSLDRELGTLGPAIFPAELDIVVDCGRVLSAARGQHEILKAADHVVVIARPDAAGLAHAQWTLELVRNLTTKNATALAVVGPSPFGVREIESALQASLVGVIPFDHQAAAMACGSRGKPHRFARSNLVASTRHLVDRLLIQVETFSQVSSGIEMLDEDARAAGNATSPTSRYELATTKKRFEAL
jgi:MinD-like ATPase involved in chromosome partitioning or flagellar assembly